jgi:hypothetical protein
MHYRARFWPPAKGVPSCSRVLKDPSRLHRWGLFHSGAPPTSTFELNLRPGDCCPNPVSARGLTLGFRSQRPHIWASPAATIGRRRWLRVR